MESKAKLELPEPLVLVPALSEELADDVVKFQEGFPSYGRSIFG